MYILIILCDRYGSTCDTNRTITQRFLKSSTHGCSTSTHLPSGSQSSHSKGPCEVATILVSGACFIRPTYDFQPYLDQALCWGYEENCPIFKSYLVPECDGKSKGWAPTKVGQLEMYYEQADFGYIKKRMKTMFPLCSPVDDGIVSLSTYYLCTYLPTFLCVLPLLN